MVLVVRRGGVYVCVGSIATRLRRDWLMHGLCSLMWMMEKDVVSRELGMNSRFGQPDVPSQRPGGIKTGEFRYLIFRMTLNSTMVYPFNME